MDLLLEHNALCFCVTVVGRPQSKGSYQVKTPYGTLGIRG
jgi:hypothetical protein